MEGKKLGFWLRLRGIEYMAPGFGGGREDSGLLRGLYAAFLSNL